MAKKRRMRRAKKTHRKVVRSMFHVSRFSVVANNLLLFVSLSLVSLVITRFLGSGFLFDLFSVMATVFGFISIAFLITLLVLVVMRATPKKRR